MTVMVIGACTCLYKCIVGKEDERGLRRYNALEDASGVKSKSCLKRQSSKTKIKRLGVQPRIRMRVNSPGVLLARVNQQRSSSKQLFFYFFSLARSPSAYHTSLNCLWIMFYKKTHSSRGAHEHSDESCHFLCYPSCTEKAKFCSRHTQLPESFCASDFIIIIIFKSPNVKFFISSNFYLLLLAIFHDNLNSRNNLRIRLK